MGAFQQGMLVVGPTTLPQGLKGSAARRAVESYDFICHLLNRIDGGDDIKSIEYPKGLAYLQDLEWENIEVLVSRWANNTNNRIERLVETLYNLWPDGAMDMAHRKMPGDPSRGIVFAGEMTWGDEPEGLGYVTLRDADQLGILDYLGVQ